MSIVCCDLIEPFEMQLSHSPDSAFKKSFLVADLNPPKLVKLQHLKFKIFERNQAFHRNFTEVSSIFT